MNSSTAARWRSYQATLEAKVAAGQVEQLSRSGHEMPNRAVTAAECCYSSRVRKVRVIRSDLTCRQTLLRTPFVGDFMRAVASAVVSTHLKRRPDFAGIRPPANGLRQMATRRSEKNGALRSCLTCRQTFLRMPFAGGLMRAVVTPSCRLV